MSTVLKKFDKNGKGSRKALGMGNCSINIWDGSELEQAYSKKRNLYFENSFCNIFIIWYFEHIDF